MSSPLAALIRQEIAASGPMTFRRFMELALYHPEFGYYTSGRAEIGRRGDYFTSVSVGPLFGKLLARQFIEIWEKLGGPGAFTIVEQGANDGTFALDVLSALESFSRDCFAAATYRIVEPAARLAAAQRARLAGQRAEWVPSLAAMRPFTGVHFSNELLDAFPVHVVEWNGRAWRERYVSEDSDGLVFVAGPLSSRALASACARIPRPLPSGYVTEVNVAARGWIREVARKLKRGYVIAVDYGHLREEYYMPERVTGTLSAYAQHRRERDPLARPGEIDLTAHVDFSALMEAGRAARLRVAGYTDQHHFIVGLGANYFENTPMPPEARAFQTLMHPSLMGQAFKVVAFAKGRAPDALTGFHYAQPPPGVALP